MTVTLFCSYARRDTLMVKDLQRYLKPFQRQGLITIIDGAKIGPNGDWEYESDKQLNTADIVLIFLSPDFLNSDYVYSTEMKRAIERHRHKEAQIIPIVLRPVYWEETPLGNIQALPTDGKAASTWSNLDEAFSDVIQGIQGAIEKRFPQFAYAKLQTQPASQMRDVIVPEDIQRLIQKAQDWNHWRETHPDLHPDLSHADLSHADLIGTDLGGVYLGHAYLTGANLTGANLAGANLTGANLSGADLSGADLSYAILGAADLSSADLSSADLTGAYLSGADLTGISFYATSLAYTVFAWVDLCTTNGLETIIHKGPSSIDVQTVKLPEGETRTHFLRGAGFSDTFIDYLPSLLRPTIQYESCFISYAHQDEALAKRLYKDLQDKGVRCWFAPHNLRPGDYINRHIEDAIHLHEKVLLLLSAHAASSSWVEHEVDTALHKEATTQQNILFPLRLDNIILEHPSLWANRLRQRHIGDFTQWQDDAIYQQRLADLLRHLKVGQP